MTITGKTVRTIIKVWKNNFTVDDLRKGNLGRPKTAQSPEKKVILFDLIQMDSRSSVLKLSAASRINESSSSASGINKHFSSKTKPHRRQQNSLWIGFPWTRRSPDLNPLNLFFWGYMKNQILKSSPATMENIREKIQEFSAFIDDDVLHRSTKNFNSRIKRCIDPNGGLYECYKKVLNLTFQMRPKPALHH